MQYSDDSFIQTRLFPFDSSGLTSFPDYWIANLSGCGNQFPNFLPGLAGFPDYRSRINESSLYTINCYLQKSISLFSSNNYSLRH